MRKKSLHADPPKFCLSGFQAICSTAITIALLAWPSVTLADATATGNPPVSADLLKKIPDKIQVPQTPALVPFDAAVNSISGEAIMKHVTTLASDEMEGREIGTAGGVRAINYLVRQMRAAGLQPGGPGGKFIQPFNPNGYNVLGMVQGSDPRLKKEFIVIGAHFDHVGTGSNGHTRGPVGPIHNGADDNASGVSVVLEVARAIASMKTKPKRSFLFILFDGEEQGMWGSRHWVANPTVPMTHVAMMINLDMVGRLRNDRLIIHGTRTAPALRRQLAQCNDAAGNNLSLETPWMLLGRSDEKPFFNNRIPVLLIHTGLHDDYHTPRDDADLLNPKGMQRIGRFLIYLARHNGDIPKRLPFRDESYYDNEIERQQQEEITSSAGSRFARLGARWKTNSVKDEEGIEILRVNQYSGASEGGIHTGDRIIRLDGQPVKSESEFAVAVYRAESPIQVEVLRRGNDEPLSLKIPLVGKPLRLGIAWRRIPAEDNVAFITYVAEGSPAWLAGVRTGDRIHAINGRPVPTDDEIRRQAATLPAPFELTLERKGRLSRIEVFPDASKKQGQPQKKKSDSATKTSFNTSIRPTGTANWWKAA